MTGPIEVVRVHVKEDSAQVTDLMGLPRRRAELHLRAVDLDRHPGRARQEGVDRYGKAVLRYHEQKVIVDAEREQAISAGLTLLLAAADARAVPRRPRRAPSRSSRANRLRSFARRSAGERPGRCAEPAEGGRGAAGHRPGDRRGPKNDVLEAEADALERYLQLAGT